MSLLNQVLNDLDQRTPAGERPPVRLATAPTVAREAKGAVRRTGPDVWRIVAWSLVGLAVLSSGWFLLVDRAAVPEIVPQTAQALALPPNPSPRPAAARSAAAPIAVVPSDVTPAEDAMSRIVQPLPLPPAAVGAEGGGPEPAVAAPRPAATAATTASSDAETLAAGAVQATASPPAGADRGGRAATPPQEPVRYRPLRNAVEPPPAEARRAARTPPAADTAGVKTASPAPSDPLAAARRAIDAGDLAEAEALLDERLGRAPGDLEGRELLLGLVLRGGRTDAALEQLALGLKHHPGHGSFILIRARLLAQAGDPDAAISLLESVPRGQATRGERLQMLAALYQQQGRYREAADSYRALLAAVPGSGPGWVGLAISLDAVGEPDAAAAYRRALELGGLPQAAETYARDRLAQLGRFDG